MDDTAPELAPANDEPAELTPPPYSDYRAWCAYHGIAAIETFELFE